jgi:hypothetical protein
VPSASSLVSSPNIPPELAKIAAAWVDLPQAVRAGITAMIEASTNAPKHCDVHEQARKKGN